MKVSIIHPTLNGAGGSELVCLNMIEALKEKDHKVLLATFEKTIWRNVEKYFGMVVKPDKEIVQPRILTPSVYGELLNFRSLGSNVYKGSDVTVVSSTMESCYCPPAEKLVVYMLPPLKYQDGLWQLYYKPYTLLQKRYLSKAGKKAILSNSLFSVKIIRKICSIDAKILYPPVNIEDFFISKKQDLVVSVGRFDPFKKYELLIKSFSKVENANCIIIGSSAGDIKHESTIYLAKLKRLINKLKLGNRIRLLVNCPFDLLRKTLSEAKVYVHTFHNEPFGISIVEGMASGCVPIVHRSGGAYIDVIDHDKYGFSFGDVGELSSKINVLIKNTALWRKYSRKAIKRSKYFDKERFKERFLDYLGLLNADEV